MKQIFQDVPPGIVFETTYGSLSDEPGLYLKLRDQKALYLATFGVARFTDQFIEVEIIGTLLEIAERKKAQTKDMILFLTPDWEQQWTKEEAEKELDNFEFKGTGWYLSKCGEGMLVSELQAFGLNPGDKQQSKKYRFSYWTSCREATESFNWIVNAPVRDDKR